MAGMELTDGDLTLRPPTPADAPAIVDGVQASLDALEPWMPWANRRYDETAALDWIHNRVDPSSVPFVLIDGSGQFAGSAGLNGIDDLNARANLGYWVRTGATGNGFATRATKLIAAYGIAKMKLHRIEIIMSVENEPSRRVAERAGATYEGVLRGRLLLQGRHHDAHSFAILPGD
jgi:RimJ/RimL family protein N-acetyltransferase